MLKVATCVLLVVLAGAPLHAQSGDESRKHAARASFTTGASFGEGKPRWVWPRRWDSVCAIGWVWNSNWLTPGNSISRSTSVHRHASA